MEKTKKKCGKGLESGIFSDPTRLQLTEEYIIEEIQRCGVDEFMRYMDWYIKFREKYPRYFT